MKLRYQQIVRLIKIHLASSKKYVRGTIYYQLHNLNSNYNKEDYLKAINMLSAEEKDIIYKYYRKNIFRLKYTRNFNSKKSRI